jgi:hypothetical protein
MGCHAERSEASAFIFLITNNCRFFAALRMTGIADFFTASGTLVVLEGVQFRVLLAGGAARSGRALPVLARRGQQFRGKLG